jgi:hypothetical protein
MKVGFLSIPAGYDKGRDIDVGVKDDLHVQRPSKTSFSTSDSVNIPFC